MNKQFRDALLGIAAAWVCLHFVGFEIYSNGGAYPGNLAWDLISPIFEFERVVLEVAAAVGAIFLIVRVYLFVAAAISYKPQKPNTLATSEISKEPSHPLPQRQTKNDLLPPPPIISPPPPLPEPTPAKLAPTPPLTPLTAQELKERAIKQITGKEFE